MTQLVVTLKDQSYLPNIRRIVRSLQGVERVRVARQTATNIPSRPRTVELRGSSQFLKGLSIPQDTTSEQLINEYIEDKYNV